MMGPEGVVHMGDVTKQQIAEYGMACINRHQGECVGPVQEYESLAGTGDPVARCRGHRREAVARVEATRRVYPDSPVAPAWFDPAAAGETWDDE